jgi:hypothetical protein
LGRKEFTLGEDKQKKQPVQNKHAKVDPVVLDDLLAQLTGMSTRVAGIELLDKADLSRKQLEALARLRSVHVTKDDNVAKIKEKLIEAIIGARLSSRAIRGLSDRD